MSKSIFFENETPYISFGENKGNRMLHKEAFGNILFKVSSAKINESIRNYKKVDNTSALSDFDIVPNYSKSYQIELTLSSIEPLTFIDISSGHPIETKELNAVINSECDTKDGFFTLTKNVWSLNQGVALFNISAHEKTITTFIDNLNTGHLAMTELTLAIYKYAYIDTEKNMQNFLFYHDNKGSESNKNKHPMKCYFDNLSFSSNYSFINKK
ncbi:MULTISPECIES: hypothetical protein [Providencia]|uniref:hypothetical protein n=1 Tax=Providencia TaxID=586 RepID=UPI001CFC99D0|nr:MULTISPECIES: hypothetical protein [Providencia]EIU7558065.1 hypothetical protein [Providencia rettgeri]MCB4843087.1 hypothetical protein [Providencia rettgeri]MCG5276315.1 hypothetical protein [Providencia rettgeri]MCG9507173.1 hypothetical protein [Providencia rettgeri]